MYDTEIERLDSMHGPEAAPRPRWEFKLRFPKADCVDAMSPITHVARLIAAQNRSAWPDIDFWTSSLPQWLLAVLPERSVEEAQQLISSTPRERWHEIPWDFRSWLEAIRDRGWEWWGYAIEENHVILVLEIVDMPPRIEAFKVILRAGEADIIEEKLV